MKLIPLTTHGTHTTYRFECIVGEQKVAVEAEELEVDGDLRSDDQRNERAAHEQHVRRDIDGEVARVAGEELRACEGIMNTRSLKPGQPFQNPVKYE